MFIWIKTIISSILLLISYVGIANVLHQKLGISAQQMSSNPAWNLSISPNGIALPPGQGSAMQGLKIFALKCRLCHGEAGIGASAETLVGEVGSLTSKYPEKTVNSYWPYATTLFDYIRRTMPTDAPFSLSANEVYALSAYILAIDGIIPADLILNAKTLPKVEMPNRHGFKSVYPN